MEIFVNHTFLLKSQWMQQNQENSLFHHTRDLSLKLLPTMQPDC